MTEDGLYFRVDKMAAWTSTEIGQSTNLALVVSAVSSGCAMTTW